MSYNGQITVPERVIIEGSGDLPKLQYRTQQRIDPGHYDDEVAVYTVTDCKGREATASTPYDAYGMYAAVLMHGDMEQARIMWERWCRKNPDPA